MSKVSTECETNREFGEGSERFSNTLELIQQNDTNYDIRYKLVLRAMYMAACLGYETGIRIDNDESTGSDIIWWVSWIILPNGLGEISWHNPCKMTEWIGYDTEEKYIRCLKYKEYINSKNK